MTLTNSKTHISKNLSRILVVYLLFMIGLSLSNIFINVYIWKVSYNMGLVIKYNVITYTVQPIAFIICGWIGKKTNLRLNLIVGMFLYTIYFLVIFVVQSQITNYIFLLGALKAISSGFFYVSYNTLSFSFSTEANREYFLGLNSLIGSSTGMLSPLVAGIIISAFHDNLGYQIIFAISFLSFLVGSLMSLGIPETMNKQKYYISSVLGLIFKNKNWEKIMMSEMVKGTRDNTIMAPVLGVLIFVLAQQESSVGNFSFGTYLVSTAASFLAGKIIIQNTRVKYLKLGTFLTAAISFIFLIKYNVLTLWIYGIVTGISITLTFISHNALSYNVIATIPKSSERKVEAIVVKEVFLNIGRIFSFALLAMIGNNFELIKYQILFLGLLQITMWISLRGLKNKKIKKHLYSPSIETSTNYAEPAHIYHFAYDSHITH